MSISSRYGYRIGIDLGGTKIEVAALASDGSLRLRHRIPTPCGYDAIISAMVELVHSIESQLGSNGSVGLGIPGVISPATGLVKNANSIVLNGHPLDRDFAQALGRGVRVDNDANCFALSEAADGAGAGHHCVFGVIIGTGCGGGIVIGGRVLKGRHCIAGEWGHVPLPWPSRDEIPGMQCWCSRHNCMETRISGTALARDCDGPEARDASTIPTRAAAGEARAREALARHVDRLARGLAVVINVIDPDVIVLGGGLSNMDHLYAELPGLLPKYVFSDFAQTPVVKNVHGDSSGVRGAAWLWPTPAAGG
jgi:fructokinase